MVRSWRVLIYISLQMIARFAHRVLHIYNTDHTAPPARTLVYGSTHVALYRRARSAFSF